KKMLKKIIKLMAAMVLAATFVSCPDVESNNGTNNNDTGKISSLQEVIDKASDGDSIDLSEAQYSTITNYNATINKAVTISGNSTSLKDGTLTVASDNVSISGITNASVTASSELKNGSLKIASSTLKNLTVNGGGINSIVIINVTITDMSVDKTMETDSEYVRICVNAETTIGNMHISSNMLIDVTGDRSPNVNNLNINIVKNDICVAFNNSLTMETPDGKAKASFNLDNTGDADFFIIVPKGGKIKQEFFEQVSKKIYGEQEKPLYHEGNEFDLSKPINDDMEIDSKPRIVADGTITIGDYNIIIDTTHDMSCDRYGDTIIFTAKLGDQDITSLCSWDYELSYGSRDVSSDYWKKDEIVGNQWSIGKESVGIILPRMGSYQLFVKARYRLNSEEVYATASATFELNIKKED
ncbi:MAG: hypothetical protein J6Y01_03900, partial [Spirochaetales bacterium]|nr:hypothetical protein [Spirochaetales bacterium]